MADYTGMVAVGNVANGGKEERLTLAYSGNCPRAGLDMAISARCLNPAKMRLTI
jgi:hypothetical protein